MHRKQVFIFLSFLILLTLCFQKVNAENEIYSIKLDKETIAKGYTVASFTDKIKLSLVPGILSESTDVEVVRLDEGIPNPWQLDRISDIYQFEFKNKAAYDNHKPFYIQLSYNQKDSHHKKVFFYDKNFNTWRPLPTTDSPDGLFVRSLIHLPYARIAVFSYPDTLTVGQATWYAYKGGNFAASPDFPKGSVLRVFNTYNNKFVDVKVNDYGPERGRFPNRAIDLDKVAFAKISPLGAGVINVIVQPLYIAPDQQGRVLGVSEGGISNELNITSKSAVAIDEDTGNILWEKNSTSSVPLASLTKLVTVKVFLDTKPTLNKIVAYSKQDENYNYEYCKPWESARLKAVEGEQFTIEDLIYGALVGSANNAIETLVRISGLDRNDFIAKMNNAVAEWGASSTHFIEPTGLSPENVSSAMDYAIISKNALSHPIIQKASTMREYKFTSSVRDYVIRNTNQIIRSDKFSITGSKTGYLEEAGYCLMTRVNSGNKNIIVVTMGTDNRDKNFAETTELIQYGLRMIK